MSTAPNVTPSPPTGNSPFKWVCLLVAVVALSAFGWMLNDVRLDVKNMSQKADKLADKADNLMTMTDKHLPRILTQTEQLADQLDRNLPLILTQTEKAVKTLDTGVPALIADKPLSAYGRSILDLVGKQNATIGVKKPGAESKLEGAIPAKQWAATAAKDVSLLSVFARGKQDVLHGLARSNTPAALHIQLAEEAPVLLADWLRMMHPESKDVN